jgi:hypothetical protein
MKRLNVKFDLDGVLADFIGHFKDFMMKRCYRVETTDNFHFDIYPKIDPIKISSFIVEASSEWSNIAPMPGARNLLTQLYIDTVSPIDIITARSLDISTETILLAQKIGMGVPVRVSFAPSEEKYVYMDNANVFVEDRRKTAIDLARKGFCVIMPDRNYNKISGRDKGMVIKKGGFTYSRGEKSFPHGKILLINTIFDLLASPYYDLLIR